MRGEGEGATLLIFSGVNCRTRKNGGAHIFNMGRRYFSDEKHAHVYLFIYF